jgi:hypothetical protein
VPAPRRPGGTATVDHCGGQSVWDVASGGRMGGVFGEDAVEVAPPSSACTHQCKAQDQVQGAAVVLGLPFPVPTANRLLPRFPTTARGQSPLSDTVALRRRRSAVCAEPPREIASAAKPKGDSPL